MNKKILSLGLVGVLCFGSLIGCGRSNVNNNKKTQQQEQEQTEEAMQQMNDSIGMPNITNYYEKKMMKKIFELRDDSNLICYAYTKNDMTGKYTFITKCIGYGIPYSVQYTSPQKVEVERNSYEAGDVPYVMPQADPNGLYMPDGLSATWIIAIDEEGNQTPMYVEPEIIVSQTKLPKRLCDESSLPSNY